MTALINSGVISCCKVGPISSYFLGGQGLAKTPYGSSYAPKLICAIAIALNMRHCCSVVVDVFKTCQVWVFQTPGRSTSPGDCFWHKRTHTSIRPPFFLGFLPSSLVLLLPQSSATSLLLPTSLGRHQTFQFFCTFSGRLLLLSLPLNHVHLTQVQLCQGKFPRPNF